MGKYRPRNDPSNERRPRGPRRFSGAGKGRGKPRFKQRRKRVRPSTSLVQPDSLQRGPASRYQALQILTAADESGIFVDMLLDERITRGDVTGEDKHLVQEVVFGAIRQRSTIDQVLDNYLQFPMKRQHVSVRWALRLATYQLVYLSRVPSHAAIHGTMEALKAVVGIEPRDVGFANAVLRRIQMDIEEKTEEPPDDPDDTKVIPARHGWCHFKRSVLPSPEGNRGVYLAVKYSHPKWLMSRWITRFGEDEATALCLANNKVPLVSVILTGKAPSVEEVTAALEAADVEVEPGVLPDSLRLRRTGDIRELEPFKKSWIRVQDETAKAIGDALGPPPGSLVLDLCAAPGGKAAQLLETIGKNGHLVACDADPGKLKRLQESLERVGGNFTIREVPADPRELPIEERFSYILVDVPCSNTGVLARRPEARWRIYDEDLATLASKQQTNQPRRGHAGAPHTVQPVHKYVMFP